MPASKKKPAAKAVTPEATVLVLRTCNKDLKSFHGFQWPTVGPVEAPQKWWGQGEKPSEVTLGWVSGIQCGGGLHGLLWGEGGNYFNWGDDAKWLVVKVAASEVEKCGDKCRFPRGEVVYCGDRAGATQYIAANGGAGKRIVGGIISAGDRGTATAGNRGTATAGDSGTATAGYSGTATAGDSGTATAGDRGTATAGDSGTATAGDSGTATAGNRGTATAGNSGTATAGDSGTATAGYSGTATAGDSGTATAGYSGTATAGDSGTATAGYSGTVSGGDEAVLSIRWYDSGKQRWRVSIRSVGEDGIKPKTKYRISETQPGEFEEIPGQA